MAITYLDTAMLLYGEREFSSRDFASRTGNPRAAKLLSELKRRGVVERTGRGRYRCLRPSERSDNRAVEWERVKRILLRCPLPKAWTGPTAVEVWTEGRYIVGPSVFRREFHLAVPRALLGRWRAYLSDRGLPVEPRRRIGARVILAPADRFKRVTLHGEPVIPKSEVVSLIRSSPSRYADAEKLLAG